MKEQKGITLIALVITIIVLLILAGVSIAMLTGDNGILTKAGDAGDRSAESEFEESVKLVVAEIVLNQKAGESTSAGEDDVMDAATIIKLMPKINDNVKLNESNTTNAAADTTYAAHIVVEGTINGKTITRYVEKSSGKISKDKPKLPTP